MNATLHQDRRDLKDPVEASASDPQTGAADRDTTPSGAGQNGRDGRGRFTAGNKGGPGNPFARRTARLRSILLEAVTDEDMEAMAKKLVEQAKAGDLAAMKLLFAYVIGKPLPCANPDRLDLDEWRLTQEAPGAAELTELGKSHLPPDLACTLAPMLMTQNVAKVAKMCSALAPDREISATAPASRKGSHGVPVDAAARRATPSPNGRNGHATPSANGRNGHATPSPNEQNGHAEPPAGGRGAAANHRRTSHLLSSNGESLHACQAASAGLTS